MSSPFWKRPVSNLLTGTVSGGQVTPTAAPVATAVAAPTAVPAERLPRSSNGAQVIRVDLPTNDIIYDPVSQTIFASVPSSAGSIGNSITAVDPLTGEIGRSPFVGSEPGKLAISDDGQFVYAVLNGAPKVARLDLISGVLDLTIDLTGPERGGTVFAEDVEVMPGSPGTIAVTLQNQGSSPRFAGVVVFDDDTRRPDFVRGFSGTGHHVNVIEFALDPGRLYGMSNSSSPTGFYRMAIDGGGILFTDNSSNLVPGGFGSGKLAFEHGLVFTTQGAMIEPERRELLGTFDVSAVSVQPDSRSGLVHFLSAAGDVATFTSFDINTFVQFGSFTVDGVSGNVNSLIEWGDDGLAFRTDAGQIFIVHSTYGGARPAAPATRPAGESGPAALQRGESLYNSNCSGCHSAGSDTRVGPGHAGVYQRAAGRTGLSADEYLRQSIIDPTAFVVDGFAAVMPSSFGAILSESEIDDLIAYLRSL